MALYTAVMSFRIKSGQNEVRLEFLLEFETGKNFQTTFTSFLQSERHKLIVKTKITILSKTIQITHPYLTA